jgi:hypothetical protein
MTTPGRSEHLTMYGIVGVAMHVVIGILIAASFAVIPAAWMATLVLLWLAGAIGGGVLWKRTVWVPLLASIVISGLWMAAFFSSR